MELILLIGENYPLDFLLEVLFLIILPLMIIQDWSEILVEMDMGI